MTSRLRILHVSSAIGFGGVELRILNELLAMRARGHLLQVICPAKSELGRRAQHSGFTTHHVEMTGWIASASALMKIRAVMRGGAFDVINTHSVADDLRIGLIARLMKRRLIVRTQHREGRQRVFNALGVTSDHVITVSECQRQRFLQSGFSAHHVQAVPTGLDVQCPNQQPSAVRHALGIPSGAIVVGCLADDRDMQGFRILLEAMCPLMECHQDVHLLLAGLDELQQCNLTRRAFDIGLKSRIHFVDRPVYSDKLLGAFDIYAVAPESCVAGSTFVEASAHGVPVVGTAVGCIPEVIENGVSGYVVLPSDRLILRSVIGKLIEDGELRRRFGIAGRQKFEPHGKFSSIRMAEALESLYLGWLRASQAEEQACGIHARHR
ncbi:glycosyltransferase family 4 protein [Achromobacter seleniivolatilans]|uniref:Glycosyltransferase family 4 protein n=1 Tax=Achromobacter seleniivolatilans TaxID=3047478 RepID=A0ABY9LZ41_9BURK|nr:glycosyltransferase family 4 protein [Achromobacter sp. R39]WMD19737.1 glycosyltransferase family 4 protein [Achromobacter sp. R39]